MLKNFFAACISILVFCQPSFADDKPVLPLKFGYIMDTVGIGAFFGTQTQRGARLALDDLKKEGFTGQIIFEDCGGDTGRAVTSAMRLLDIEHVDALICDLTAVCTAVAPKAKQAGVVLIYNSPAASIHEQYSRAFRNFIDYAEACQVVARHWRARGIKVAGSLMPNQEFGEMCLRGMLTEYPRGFVYRYNPGDDLRTAVTLFKSHELKAVMHVGFERDFLEWMRLSREQDFYPIQGLVEIMLSDVLTKEGAKNLEGATIIGYEDLPDEFRERLHRTYPVPSEVNVQGAALAYNAVKSLSLAFSKCPERRAGCVSRALRKDVTSGLLGFRGWGDAPEYPLVIKHWKNGQLVTTEK